MRNFVMERPGRKETRLRMKGEMPTFVMTIGLPGSGKSTCSRGLSLEGMEIVSSDAIREEFFGDAGEQKEPWKIFEEMGRRTRSLLLKGKSVIYDATNLNSKRRISFLKTLEHIKCYKVAYVVVVPLEVCVIRAQERKERPVSESVVMKMAKSFTFPWWFEGWDSIEVHQETEVYGHTWEFDLFDLIETQRKILHDNPHHFETIGEHLWMTGNSPYLRNEFERSCGFAHDIGKPLCKVFANCKGEPRQEAHFYGHESISAYMSMFESETSFSFKDNADEMRYKRAVVIQNHMAHFSYKGNIGKLYKQLGSLGESLKALELADTSSSLNSKNF